LSEDSRDAADRQRQPDPLFIPVIASQVDGQERPTPLWTSERRKFSQSRPNSVRGDGLGGVVVPFARGAAGAIYVRPVPALVES